MCNLAITLALGFFLLGTASGDDLSKQMSLAELVGLASIIFGYLA